MPVAPSGLEIVETRSKGPVRVIYAARQEPLGRPVQLVTLAPGVLSSSPRARALEYEAKVLAKLDHSNILRLYDLKRDGSQLWLVIEDVDGPQLRELISKKMSWQCAAAIGLDLARALSHAHHAGETHGKLRAASVQLKSTGQTKLSGFGELMPLEQDQAEALEPDRSGGLSPEGSVGQAVGPLSDLFSWGALLYEMLTTVQPFGDPLDTHYPARVRNEQARPLLSLHRELPPPLERLINQCLDKHPSERPSSAQAIVQELEKLIGSTTAPLVLTELQKLQLTAVTHHSKAAPPPLEVSPRRGSPRGKYVALLVAAAFVGGALLSGGLIKLRTASPSPSSPSQKTRDLPLEQSLLLRAVASPWAHVLVDGLHRETTPFARPIALSPGPHLVRFEHPHAPPEERSIDGQAGQALLLNVQMHVKRPLVLEVPGEISEEESP